MSLSLPSPGVGLHGAAASAPASTMSLSLFCTHRRITAPTFQSPHRFSSTLTLAKRKSSPASSPPPQDEHVVLDDDFRDSINQLSTEAVKVMLSDNMRRMEDLRDKIMDLELYFEKESEEDALAFVLVIREMIDHRLPPEAKQLKGIYKKAFDKIFSIVEDSGWALKGDEEEFGVPMVDEELIPPTMQSEYR